MKRIVIFLLMLASFTSLFAKNEGRELADWLQQCIAQEEVHPDSIFVLLPQLERMKQEAKTPQERAMYATALGRMYSLRTSRSQSRNQLTLAPQDSMQEWSQRDYIVASRRNFSEALQDLDLLYHMPTSDWVPLVTKGKDDAIFGNNMLSVVWYAMHNSLDDYRYMFGSSESKELTSSYPLPTFANMIAFYKSQNMREACFCLEMDSVNQLNFRDQKKASWERITREYNDLDVSAQAAQRWLNIRDDRENWDEWYAAEARKARYNKLKFLYEYLTKYKDRGSIYNDMLRQIEPEFHAKALQILHPDQEGEIEITRRNVNACTFSIYRLNDEWSEEEVQQFEHLSSKELKGKLKKMPLVKKLQLKTDANESPFTLYRDTLKYRVEEFGRFLMVADYQTPIKLKEKTEPVKMVLRTSRLKPVCTPLGLDTRVTIVDALSGKPLPGVEVKVEWMPTNRQNLDTLRSTLVTDERGIVLIASKQNRRHVVSFHQGEDKFCPNMSFYAYSNGSKDENDKTQEWHCAINTDRGIYRPGQTIQASIVVYGQRGWDAETLAGKKVELALLDSYSNTLVDTTLVTDEFGCASVSLSLPKSAKLGDYSLEVESANTGIDIRGGYKEFRVEEYKRPTFEVKMDEPKLADSITFSGRALTYAGVPVRKARVTGSYRWSNGWTKSSMLYDRQEPEDCDTLWTDDEGRFTISVPKTLTKEELLFGRWVTLYVDVLSDNGETHQGSSSASLCSTPLRMSAEVRELQDKDRLKPWLFELYDALGKDVKGDVRVTLKRGTESVFTTTLESHKQQVPEGLKSVPSGAYTLYAEAIVKGDTARSEQRVVLFSMADNSLPVDTTFWFYMPSRKFTKERPIEVQLGTSLKDVSLYYVVSTHKQVYQDQLVNLSNELTKITIPYEESMDKDACLAVFFVKDGVLYSERRSLELEQPDNQLKMHWTTFRDKLQPGQHEKWSLQIARPDGTPAQANLLATLYDASLDAFVQNRLNLRLSRSYYYYGRSPWTDGNYPSERYGSFNLKYKKLYTWEISRLNDDYFRPDGGRKGLDIYFTDGYTNMRLRGAGGKVLKKANSLAIPEHEIGYTIQAQAPAMREFEGLTITTPDEALQGRIAGLDIVSNAERDENVDWSALRTNFNETAFFYPQLRTNEQGEVTLDFTLPESLTRWHFLGLAHTKDLMIGNLDESIVAQKSLMAQLYLPRFLRVGDKAVLTATIQNIDPEVAEHGTAIFELMDEETDKVLLRKKVEFSLKALQDSVFIFDYEVVDEHRSLVCRWKANGQTCSDGEQRLLPVLSDREVLTKSKVITLTKQGTTNYDLSQLFPKDATQRKLTVEYTTHPIWCALQALPSLYQPKYEDVVILTTSFYALSLTQHLCGTVNDLDKVLKVDADSLKESCAYVFNKVKQLQNVDGSFSWCPGFLGSTYLTREVMYRMARLYNLTHSDDAELQEMIDLGIKYLRSRLDKDSYINTSTLDHLYTVTLMGKSLDSNEKRLLKELSKVADDWKIEDRAQAAIVLKLQDKNRATNRLMDGVEKYLVGTPETGRYIDYPSGSFTCIDCKIRIHTQIMEAVQQTRPEATELWQGLRQWLLMEKRTTDWDTPANTVDAVYALLSAGMDDVQDEAQDVLDVKGKGHTQRLTSPDSRKGYLKSEVSVPSAQKLTITKRSKGESWGAVYAEFEQQIDSVSASWQDINIRREISLSKTNQGGQMRMGDRVHVRYVITAKRDYEYVMLRAPRPAACEPTLKYSGYTYSNGLAFYRSVKDSSTDYYIERMPKGTYVLEEDILVERPGQYSAGITTIECLYAPEFRAYTSNLKVNPVK